MGVVLNQEKREITYFSENLNEEKHKYFSYDKEFYAIIQALKRWIHYLMPKEFILYTDNHALQFISSQPKLNQKHAKWVEFMQNFTFFIKHTSGKSNKVVDSLSRVNLLLKEFRVNTLGFDELIAMDKGDANFQDIYVACENLVSSTISQLLECMLQ